MTDLSVRIGASEPGKDKGREFVMSNTSARCNNDANVVAQCRIAEISILNRSVFIHQDADRLESPYKVSQKCTK